MSNLVQRVLTALVGIPIVLGLTWLGGWWFFGLILVAALISQWETYGLLKASGGNPIVGHGLVLGATVLYCIVDPSAIPFVFVVVTVTLLYSAFRKQPQPLSDASATIFGAIYPTLLLGLALVLRSGDLPAYGENVGFWLVLMVLAGIWGADTLAYFVGRAIGKHPLAPSISPKKTWEGAVGGLFGAAIAIVAIKLSVLPFLSWLDVGALVFCCGIAGPLGDLAESRFKRAAGVKDSANWLPGHGGLLDRLDAAIIAIPLATLYLKHVAGVL